MIRLSPVRRHSLTVTMLVAVTLAVGVVVRKPAQAQGREGVLRVATYNIHKGADGDDHYDLRRTIEAIASFDADIVGLQEVMRNDPSFNCDDQPGLIAEGLTRLTQRKWTFVYGKSWVSENHECMDRGRGDGPGTEGVVLFTPQQVMEADSIKLVESRVGVEARLASMPDVPIVTTHLAAGRRFQEHRIEQIGALLPWMEAKGAGIFLGDLNSRPFATELTPLMARYRDAWLEGSERGLSKGDLTCCTTRPAGMARIDYIFYDPTSPLQLESVEIRETATEGLGEVSDHRPVIATFRRAPSLASAAQ